MWETRERSGPQAELVRRLNCGDLSVLISQPCFDIAPPEFLEADVKGWIEAWNADPKPFIWTKTADQILEAIAAYCGRINDSGH